MKGMGNSISFLDLPVQWFVAGSAIGVMLAFLDYLRTGKIDRWGPIVSACGALLFYLGLLIQLMKAVIW